MALTPPARQAWCAAAVWTPQAVVYEFWVSMSQVVLLPSAADKLPIGLASWAEPGRPASLSDKICTATVDNSGRMLGSKATVQGDPFLAASPPQLAARLRHAGQLQGKT